MFIWSLSCTDTGPEHGRQWRVQRGQVPHYTTVHQFFQSGHMPGIHQRIDHFPVGGIPAYQQYFLANRLPISPVSFVPVLFVAATYLLPAVPSSFQHRQPLTGARPSGLHDQCQQAQRTLRWNREQLTIFGGDGDLFYFLLFSIMGLQGTKFRPALTYWDNCPYSIVFLWAQTESMALSEQEIIRRESMHLRQMGIRTLSGSSGGSEYQQP